MKRSFLIYTALLAAAASPAKSQVLERVRSNDNRARAGILSGNRLVLRMEARMAEWHPQGDNGPGAAIPVFTEIGRAPQIPGPLIRVPGGTEVTAVLRNAIPNTTLTIHGLHSRPAVGAAFNDSIQLPYGQIQTVRFKLDRPGTYYYWGSTKSQTMAQRTSEDAQLTGAIVVDEPDVRAPLDRIFVIGMWADGTGADLGHNRQRMLFVLNGKSWPYTDRLVYEKGDVVRWRVINASADVHPMHLHGFYYRVSRRGDGRADSTLTRSELVNTELMLPGSTMTLAWTADRLGNWLFHCHIPDHIEPRGPLGMPPQHSVMLASAGSHANPAASMGGLVTAIEVKPAEDDTTAKAPAGATTGAAAALPDPARRLRMLLRPNTGTTPSLPYYGVTFADANTIPPDVDVGQHIGPPLVLTKGEPVSIMVANLLTEPTSIHWHGIELESYFDGVPGLSGIKPKLAPVIAPGDSFEVRMAPPRAGTFIYHTHVNESQQHRAGVAGALIVTEKGKWDPTRDIPVVISSPSDSAEELRAVLLNGALRPQALELKRGTSYRLRLVNITMGRPGLYMELTQDTLPQNWRVVAKDGADIPAAARTVRAARLPISIGETYDVEFFPTRVGEFRLEAKTARGVSLGFVPVRVN